MDAPWPSHHVAALETVNERGVDVSEHVFFTRNRIAVRLTDEDGRFVVAALSKDARRKLQELL